MRLPPNWFAFAVRAGVDPNRPGLYERHIEGVGSYVGKYKRVSRPRQEYGRNVSRLLAGLPYRRSNPNGFRRIHHVLGMAHCYGTPVRLTILENVDPENIYARELAVIRERGSLNDPPYAGCRLLSDPLPREPFVDARKALW